MRRLTGLVFVTSVLLPASAARATVYNEAVNGDLSGARLAPTVLVSTPGSNTITATSVSGDLEYLRVTIPAGHRLSAINVVSSTSTSVSFIAVQNGDTFSVDPAGATPALLLGYAHFGPGNFTLGTDILDNMGSGSGALGFTPPLPAGNYTFWSQETGGAVTYTLDFVVTAAPVSVPLPRVSIGLLALGFAAIGMRHLWSGSRVAGRTAGLAT